ncbi:hypothetical protein BpHYR1_002227 [Brachionus plicatilis]|uniref:Uncharacterized protein n=1 Tax=Brachionus plicatilis TaxID=10195 RepID=A0A3M7SEJ5_BRAPC|nr:hypothetical protein BpHYR1_002227 [Brachionus plicatilis]
MGSTNATPFGYKRINLIDGQVVYPDEKFYQRVYERYIPEMIQRNEIPYNRSRYRRYASDCGPNCDICNSNCSSRCGPDCSICNRYDPDCSDCEDSCGPDCCPPRRLSSKSRIFNRSNVWFLEKGYHLMFIAGIN